jgi:fucose 4-O-acetylase-like acetyltransferase
MNPTNTKQTRIESLDCLKGIAILLVMFGHVQVHNQMTDPYLYDMIKSIQMPMFFLISGYLSGAGTKIRSTKQYMEKLGKRAVSYLLPFFSWLVVQHITFVPRALKTVLFQLDYGLWFLMVLFLFSWITMTGQLVQAKVKQEWGFWAVFLGSSVLILLAYLKGVTFLSPSLLVIYLPYYGGACLTGMHPELFAKIPIRIQRSAALVFGIVFLIMAMTLDLVTVTGIGMLCVQTLASFLGCLALIRLVLDWKENRWKTKLAALGRYTLEIYVLHYQFARVLNPTGKIFLFWSPSGLLYSVAAFAVMSVITAAAIWLIDRIPPLRLLLFGKR